MLVLIDRYRLAVRTFCAGGQFIIGVVCEASQQAASRNRDRPVYLTNVTHPRDKGTTGNETTIRATLTTFAIYLSCRGANRSTMVSHE
jgi:hypothetical protein